MEYRENIEIEEVKRTTTTQVPLCEFCGDDAEYVDEAYADIGWCDTCIAEAYSHIVAEHIGYQYACDLDLEAEVEYEE